MLDHYIRGKVDRISPEAPVPVVNVENFDDRAGGAANVAMNIKAMEASAFLFSIIGNDAHGNTLLNILKSNKINSSGVLIDKSGVTTLKARIIGNNHQLLRYDVENNHVMPEKMEEALFQNFAKAIAKEKFDAVILEDYNKGVLTAELISRIINLCNKAKVPTLVDPKKHNFFAYTNCTLFKPNLKELSESLPHNSISTDMTDLSLAAKTLNKKINSAYTFVTLGDRGIFYHTKNQSAIIPARIRKVADVSGAGDTVIALSALGLAAQLPAVEIAHIANLAGGQVCEHPGVVSVNKSQLLAELTT